MKAFITLLFLTCLIASEAQAAWPRESGAVLAPKQGSLSTQVSEQIKEIKENPDKKVFIFISFSF